MTALVLCREDINPHLLVCVTAQHTASPRNGSGSKSRLASSCCCLSDLCRAVCARLHVTALPLGAGGAKSQDPLEKAGGGGNGLAIMSYTGFMLGWAKLQNGSQYGVMGHCFVTNLPSHHCLWRMEVPRRLGDVSMAEIRQSNHAPVHWQLEVTQDISGYLHCLSMATLLDFNQVREASPTELKDTLGQFPCMLTAPITCNRIAWLSAK